MRRLLSLLIILAVLICGLQIGEGDVALDGDAHHHAGVERPMSADSGKAAPDAPDAPAKLADAGHHHHCPIASHPGDAALLCAVAGEAMLSALPVTAMRSLSRAPPVEPPSA